MATSSENVPDTQVIRSQVARLVGYERMAGEEALLKLNRRAQKTALLAGRALAVGLALAEQRPDDARVTPARVILGWLGDAPRAQWAMIERGYAFHASAIAAGSIDCAVGLQYWCQSEARAERWRTHERVGGVPFKTLEILPKFAAEVSVALALQGRREWTAERLAARWQADYSLASMVKHGNPLALRQERLASTQDGGEAVHSGPCTSHARLARASADLLIAEEMFFASALAAGKLLQCTLHPSYSESLCELLAATEAS